MADPRYGAPEWVVAPGEGWVAPRGRTPDGRVLASPGRRVLGFLVDLAIWSVPQLVIMGVLLVVVLSASLEDEDPSAGAIVAMVLLYLLLFAVAILRIVVEAEKVARSGQTWGMRALRLRAVDSRFGGPVTRGRAWGRAAFGAWISSQLFGLGYWWAFFDNRNRCLHDLVCSVVVVDER